MQPTLVSAPSHREGWVYEEKYDGWRMVAIKGKHGVRLMSRKGHDLTERFPELVKALSGLKSKAFILDGEVAVCDRAFVSRFEWLRRRPTDEPATLPVYMVFDLLKLDGRNLHLRRAAPLEKRSKGVGGGGGPRLRGPRGEESRVPLRAGPHARVAQDQAAPLPRGRARVGAEAVSRALGWESAQSSISTAVPSTRSPASACRARSASVSA
jgi:hypothetical protein